jgi:hypothetical protein
MDKPYHRRQKVAERRHLHRRGGRQAPPEALHAQAPVHAQQQRQRQAQAPVADEVQDAGQQLPPRAAHDACRMQS